MTQRNEEPWSPYEYPSSWLTNVEYRIEGEYAYMEIPQGTVLYHGSQTLPITVSASGKSALPDVLNPNAYLAERSKAKGWGFPFSLCSGARCAVAGHAQWMESDQVAGTIRYERNGEESASRSDGVWQQATVAGKESR